MTQGVPLLSLLTVQVWPDITNTLNGLLSPGTPLGVFHPCPGGRGGAELCSSTPGPKNVGLLTPIQAASLLIPQDQVCTFMLSSLSHELAMVRITLLLKFLGK